MATTSAALKRSSNEPPKRTSCCLAKVKVELPDGLLGQSPVGLEVAEHVNERPLRLQQGVEPHAVLAPQEGFQVLPCSTTADLRETRLGE